MLDVISHNGKLYPAFQGEGNSAQYAVPFAQKVCKGVGYDIGCNNLDWCLPGATPIDPLLNQHDALNLPEGLVDYIFSSHCLEHLENWVDVLDYWATKIKPGGVLCLYLPDYSQEYWRVYSNRKHIHTFFPDLIKDYLNVRAWEKIFVSGVDLNNSFLAIAEKPQAQSFSDFHEGLMVQMRERLERWEKERNLSDYRGKQKTM